MKQKVAVAIGTGDEQSYFINLAKKLGCFVIGFDKSINSKGSSICDVFYPICISDVDKIINTLEKYKPKFVIPSPIGKRLTTIGLIHDYFQINSFNHFATESVTNKLIFSQLLKRLNIPHPQTRIFQDIDQIIANFDQIDFPVIAKPNEGSGSRGVFIIKNKNSILDFKNYYNQNKRWQLRRIGTNQEVTLDSVFLEFDAAQQRVRGFSGCNYFNGGYRLTDHGLTFGAIASTKRACLEAPIQTIEMAFYEALGQTTRYHLAGDQLHFYGGDRLLLTFQPIP
ncbi:hypothetical protein BRW62_01495 [Parathermosynechococcus lividus PCC 6715]|uniref:ATP-grasp domain-containing protein n=1 Tax=Parathermosynechococcus lividus PCC 6715 TaxID=1917166 RepID=A0A2D2PZI3_PARLV|nr:META domain-containing protein [Thermostichus lividus]ATS17633.1 hypothetical protein BRW62_01495 [Thermostichus lividus PCC 6715]